MARFIKGNTGKPLGAKNKVTTDMRQWLSNFIDSKRNQLEKDWKALEPRERIIMFEKMLRYTLPTLSATSLTTDFNKMSDENLDRIINELKQSAYDPNGES